MEVGKSGGGERDEVGENSIALGSPGARDWISTSYQETFSEN